MNMATRLPGRMWHAAKDRLVRDAANRKFLTLVGGGRGTGWWPVVRESFAGAWQQNVLLRRDGDVLENSAIFACVTLIASDISKLPLRLMRQHPKYGDVWLDWTRAAPIDGADYALPLRRPNSFQTAGQFAQNWISSLMLTGNAYVLLDRAVPAGIDWATEQLQNAAGAVTSMYVLDSSRVMPLVSPSGEVFYELYADNIAGIERTVRVPASAILHDRINCLWHPLCGVSPLFAAALSAGLSVQALRDSSIFFQNRKAPGGVMTAPGPISDETAQRLKASFDENFGGDNSGNLLVLGDGLRYEAMTATAEQSQLAELLNWSAVDIARAFKIPPFLVAAGPPPPGISLPALTLGYFQQVLQPIVESMEALLDYGLGLPANLRTSFDVDALLRMDQAARYAAYKEGIVAGWLAPNEARRRENLVPVEGGDSPLMQQQNYSLAALAKRDAREDPFATGATRAAELEAKVLERAQAHREWKSVRAATRGGAGPTADGDTGSSGAGYLTRDVRPTVTGGAAARRKEILRRRRAAMAQLAEFDDEETP
jgi:HK97 family phage portal protein